MDTSFIQSQISAISAWRVEFQWLVDFGLLAEKVVHFGCEPPGKSLGLMWAVQAEKILGIDPDPQVVHREETALNHLQTGLRTYWNFLARSDDVTEEQVRWWNEEVPDFFKQELTKHEFFIDFITRDFTQFVNLPAGFFDLAFCDFVLHKIRWDHTRKEPAQLTRYVINQMARLVRPGGFVAAYEWAQTGLHDRLDFRRIFETAGAGLTVIHLHEDRLDNWRGKGYATGIICTKK